MAVGRDPRLAGRQFARDPVRERWVPSTRKSIHYYWGDTLAPVLQLGRRQTRKGWVLGLAGALFIHGGGAARALASLVDVHGFASSVQKYVSERLRTTYDLDDEPPPPPPPPEPPKPETETEAKPIKPENIPPEQAPPPPPAAAKAGKILTAEPDPNEPVDLTDQGFVSGVGDRYVGGTTATKGTSDTAVHNPAAVATGVPGGTGTAPSPAKDLSRPALPKSLSWACPFPADADMEQINSAVVTVVVTVAPDGRAKSARVIKDPGHGFGANARQCALRSTYNPGYDLNGNRITTSTPPFNIRFTR